MYHYVITFVSDTTQC